MYNKNQAYQNIEKSIRDSIIEEQAKLGYRKESVQLYYPLSSLNHFFHSEASVDDMNEYLKGFSDYSAQRLGSTLISHRGDRFCFRLSPEASEFIHENYGKNEFLFELVTELQKKDTTLESIISFFKKWESDCIIKNMDNGEFDILIRFSHRDDPYLYCFKDEGCHIIYHRFLPEDYDDFGF